MHLDFHYLTWSMIGVARDAIARHPALRAVAGHAICLRRHQHVTRFVTLAGVMAIVTFHARVLRVIELGLRHPAVDQNRRGHDGPPLDRLHLVTKRAARKVCAVQRRRLPLRFVGIRLEKNRPLYFFVAPKLDPELVHLLRHKRFHIAGRRSLFVLEAGESRVLRRERPQERPHQIHVSVREMKLRVILIELEGVAGLAVRGETNPLVKAAARLRLYGSNCNRAFARSPEECRSRNGAR